MSLLLTQATVGAESQPGAVPDDRALLRVLSDLELGASLVDRPRERAAFIIRDKQNGYGCLVWESQHLWGEARYRGPVPPGTVGVAHTHPLDLPRPSLRDVSEAKRTGLVFYVTTRWTIYRIEPADGDVVAMVRNRDWTAEFRSEQTMRRPCR